MSHLGYEIKKLGFGLMRLPKRGDNIDVEQVKVMVDRFLADGFTYFDTAWAYPGSEDAIRQALVERHPREAFQLATKNAAWIKCKSREEAIGQFETSLRQTGAGYFDFYLLHNVYENSVHVYDDPRWGIVDYFVEQKKQGRIKHLGFSSHADLPCLTDFLNRYGDEMEFCQLQFNYLDWTLQHGKEKDELLRQRNIPLWVMEPVRGGKLVTLEPDEEQRLHAIRPDDSIASFGFRWLQGFDNITMVLSGMSNMAQMADNIKTFDHLDPLSDAERDILMEAAERMKNAIPCTACRYCCDGCPQGLDIPDLLHKYNQLRVGSGSSVKMQLDALPQDKWPAACIACGACAAVCPQKIAIPDELAAFAAELDKLPSWAEVCKARAEAERQEKASRGR